MVNRIVVGAHYGLRDWLIQRVSAVVMATGCIALALYLLLHPHLGYDGWTALFSSAPVRAYALLFLLSLFFAPLAGTVSEINSSIVDDPAKVNAAATGDGWFFKLKLSDLAAFATLLTEAEYKAFLETQ